MTCYLVKAMIREALAKGYLVDRSNGDGPLEHWDGWLLLDLPEGETLIETDKLKVALLVESERKNRL